MIITTIKKEEEGIILQNFNFDQLTKKDKDYLQEITHIINNNEINKKNEAGETLLTCAISNQNIELVEFLLRNGADVNGTNHDSFYPLEVAVLSGELRQVELLNEHGKLNYTRSDDFSLIFAAANGEYAVTEFLLKKGMKVNQLDENNSAAIHWAAQEGHLNIIELIINNGGSIDLIDDSDQTALYIAAGNNNLEIVRFLLEHGANPNLPIETSPVIIASSFDGYETLEYLLSYGANIDAQDLDGRTALFYSIVRGNLEMSKYLLSKGSSTQMVDHTGIAITALENEELRLKLRNELF